MAKKEESKEKEMSQKDHMKAMGKKKKPKKK